MAVVLDKGIFIVAAKRTPFGRMRGLLRNIQPSELLAAAAEGAFRAGAVQPGFIDTVNIGQVYTLSGSSDGGTSHRYAALKLGVPLQTPVLGINKLCGSGFQAVVNSAQDILTGVAKVSLAGGTDNMSMIPSLVRNIRFGTEFGKINHFEDFLISGSFDTYCNFTMAQTAENLAEKYDLKREVLDRYAYGSQQRWKTAHDQGAFKAEMAPITVEVEGRKVVVDEDEFPRSNITMEALGMLPALFRKGGVGTAGNSTGISNGAGAIILASEDAVKRYHLQPLARLVAWSCAGVEPSLMGLGPVPAVKELLAATQCQLADIDMVEINEPFAGQLLSSAMELGVDERKLNMNGGAIAIGHPPAATGVRITAHLAHELS